VVCVRGRMGWQQPCLLRCLQSVVQLGSLCTLHVGWVLSIVHGTALVHTLPWLCVPNVALAPRGWIASGALGITLCGFGRTETIEARGMLVSVVLKTLQQR
jgi:hypothetical protein